MTDLINPSNLMIRLGGAYKFIRTILYVPLQPVVFFFEETQKTGRQHYEEMIEAKKKKNLFFFFCRNDCYQEGEDPCLLATCAGCVCFRC